MNDPNASPRWQAEILGDPRAFEALAEGLPASELWSLLLLVASRRAAARTPASLLRQWERDRFTTPSVVGQRDMLRTYLRLLEAAEGFEALELSPLAPLGACSAVGLASQNKIVSSLRGTEVVSDTTNVMALEAASRLRRDEGAVVRLATCQRVVRAQPAPKGPGFAQHFGLFALVSAGREQRNHAFTAAELCTHIRTHLRAFDLLEQDGFSFPDRRVKLLSTPARTEVADHIERELGRIVPISRGVLEHPYYTGGLRFLLSVRGPDGREVPLSDGGSFDWIAKLTSRRGLAMVGSGMGAQLVPVLFRAPAPGSSSEQG
jgi:hypothetical protein